MITIISPETENLKYCDIGKANLTCYKENKILLKRHTAEKTQEKIL